MGEQDQETRQRLLRCAKAEFLSRGFEHASLRRICGAAGVTTVTAKFASIAMLLPNIEAIRPTKKSGMTNK